MATRNILRFDGNGDYVSLTNNAAHSGFTTHMAFSCWMRFNQASSVERDTFAAVYDINGNQRSWLVRRNQGSLDNTMTFVFSNNGEDSGAVQWTPSVGITSGVWYYFEFVWRPSGIQCFFGTEDEAPVALAQVNIIGTLPSALHAATVPMQFGRVPYNTTDNFDGDMIEARLWGNTGDRTLDKAQADYKDSLVGNETGLVGYWPMNEGSGVTIDDLTATNVNGTITNAVWGTANDPHVDEVEFDGPIPTLQAIVGEPFSFDLSAYFVGSETPFTYALTGTLPAYASFNTSTCVISGTADSDTNIEGLQIVATDAGANQAPSNTFSINVSAEAFVRLQADLPIYSDVGAGSLFNGTGYAARVINATANTITPPFTVNIADGVLQVVDAAYQTPGETYHIWVLSAPISGVFPATVVSS